MIHPSAIIHPKARIAPDVEIGPFAVIDQDVALGSGCQVGPHVYLTGRALIGEGNQFHAGAVIGDAPQDLAYKGEATGVTIGDHNVFREHVTVHRSSKASEPTSIGSNNLFMAHCHVGHNSRIGSHVIMANGALLGGYTQVQDRAFISGNCLVHQFTRVGTLALMQGGSGISKDLPPCTIARDTNTICGLNTVGLRRVGVSAPERLELKKIYHLLFLSGKNLTGMIEEAERECSFPLSRKLIEFIREAPRGVCLPGPASTPKI
jgi:UDP-N-acetylglucosamine acyltransferase